MVEERIEEIKDELQEVLNEFKEKDWDIEVSDNMDKDTANIFIMANALRRKIVRIQNESGGGE